MIKTSITKQLNEMQIGDIGKESFLYFLENKKEEINNPEKRNNKIDGISIFCQSASV